eukprot:g9704.t1
MKAAAESKAQEEAEHTFKPSINERSKAIFRHMINTGQPWHDRVHAGDRPGKPPGTKALTPAASNIPSHHRSRRRLNSCDVMVMSPSVCTEKRPRAEPEPKKTRALKKRISQLLAQEVNAQKREAELRTDTPKDRVDRPSQAPGVSKLVEALSRREKTRPKPAAG